MEYGRKNRKFCSETCKNNYHNREYRGIRVRHARVKHCIDRNYDILDKLFKMKVYSIDITDIIMMGFNPEFSTGWRKSKTHIEYRCYEYRYCLSSNKLFNLEKGEII